MEGILSCSGSRTFDYGGLLLYTAGLVLFILGLSSGGSLYPWADAKVIAPLVVGFVCLILLFVYETYMDLKEPLILMHQFKNRDGSLLCSVYRSAHWYTTRKPSFGRK